MLVKRPHLYERGVSMIEVLVAIMILTIGLLGAAGMQSRLQVAEVEAYQRAQAIVLLQDMVDRISNNRAKAQIEAYVTASALGTGSTYYADNACATAPASLVVRDKCEWELALLGGAERKSGTATDYRGAMNGARGCISNPVTTMPREVEVAVVWQGNTPTRAPTNTTCGENQYGGAANEKYRRAIVAKIKIGCLQNDATTGLCVTP